MVSTKLLMRPLTMMDLTRIDEIYRKHHANNFGIPSLDNSVSQVITLADGKILAGGILKALGELVMVLDLDAPTATRMHALDMLLARADREAKLHGFEQVHIFTQEKFAQILEKHYQFKRVDDVVLVKEVPLG